jgi:hypothetical protein
MSTWDNFEKVKEMFIAAPVEPSVQSALPIFRCYLLRKYYMILQGKEFKGIFTTCV